MKKTKLAYEKYLDELSPSFESEQWIIGGIHRHGHATMKRYGRALRKYDPIGFEVGYQEWKR